MKNVYILLEKDMKTDRICVEGVYESHAIATAVMEECMSIFEDDRAYKIETKTLES